MGSRQKIARRFAEGIRKFVGNVKEDRRKEDQRTYRKITGVCRNPDGEDEGGQASSSLAVSIRWISAAKLLFDLATLA
ncbi:hypothetical protein BHE74_00041810 [Ensete ventricosum]|nr:hypothetical protein BHE74_00041810 [Ensete ventricosum]